MNAQRLSSIVLIFVATSLAWLALSGAISYRSQNTYSKLGQSYDSESSSDSGSRSTVEQLWGSAQTQQAPQVWAVHKEKVAQTNEKGKKVVVEVEKTDPVVLTKSRINTKINLEPRRKGLLWYNTYKVKFAGDYAFKNEFPEKRKFNVRFKFPSGQAAYNNVLLYINGKRTYPGANMTDGVITPVELNPNETATVQMAYGSQGMDKWYYQFTDDGAVAGVRDFSAAIQTNCSNIDFPQGCLSPTHKALNGSDGNLEWKYGDLISGSKVGISMPQKLQPGPFASRLSLFAPVSLFFFFAMLVILSTVKDIRLHPINYLFLAATFFTFHLLFSYLVDHLAPFPSFVVASIVSLLLTISYLRLVVNWKFAMFHAGVWQFVFLVLFTYAFFFEGYTGLTITIGAILTLAVLMQLTGRVNWDEKLGKPPVLNQTIPLE